MATYEKDVKRRLRKEGKRFQRQAGSHEQWKNADGSGHTITVPSKIKSRHTANSVMRQAGLAHHGDPTLGLLEGSVLLVQDDSHFRWLFVKRCLNPSWHFLRQSKAKFMRPPRSTYYILLAFFLNPLYF